MHVLLRPISFQQLRHMLRLSEEMYLMTSVFSILRGCALATCTCCCELGCANGATAKQQSHDVVLQAWRELLLT